MWGWLTRLKSLFHRAPTDPNEILASFTDERLIESLFTPEARATWYTSVVYFGSEIQRRRERMIPLLNTALRDPRCFEQGDLPQPAKYLLLNLTQFEDFESAPFVADNAERCDDGARSYLIRYLAASGDMRIAQTLRDLVGEDAERYDSDCYEGLVHARDSGRAPKAFLERFEHTLAQGDAFKARREAEREADPLPQLYKQLGTDSLSQYVPFSPELEDLDAMPPARRTASLAWTLIEWVRGDGFHFYFDSYGYLAPDAPEAFEAIGAMETAALVRTCLDIVGKDGVAVNHAIREEAMRQLSINTPDDFWHSYESDLFGRSKSDEALLLRYVLEHREAFDRQFD